VLYYRKGDMATTQITPAAFVQSLRDEVMRHPAVTHPFLERFAHGGLAAWQLWGYASQHYRLVCSFTAYLEALTQRTPDKEIRRLVEWAIPRMFAPLVQGIEQSVALDPDALEYFRLHIDLDVKHGQMLEQCLIRWTGSEAHRDEIRRGALRSLEARAAFWSSLAEQLFPDPGRERASRPD
jgi:pyrroloquinoline quinone (PQQ) biosynthesis protein C